jgi:hypothetical protein
LCIFETFSWVRLARRANQKRDESNRLKFINRCEIANRGTGVGQKILANQGKTFATNFEISFGKVLKVSQNYKSDFQGKMFGQDSQHLILWRNTPQPPTLDSASVIAIDIVNFFKFQ